MRISVHTYHSVHSRDIFDNKAVGSGFIESVHERYPV